MDSNGAKRAKLPGGGQSSKGGSDGGAPGDQEELDAQYEEEDEAGQKAATNEPMSQDIPTMEKVTGARTSPALGSRRTLRPRQAAIRSGRSKSRTKDDKAPVMLYKEGEPLRDLHKYLGDGPEDSLLVEVRIPSEAVTCSNRQVRARQLWGTDVYTDDSDLVAVLMHTGFYLPAASPPPPAIFELRAFVRPLPPQDGYDSKARNSIRSRAWGAARSGCSFRVEQCKAITPAGASVELDASLARAPAAVPTFVQAAETRVLNTRSAANSQERRQRFVQEVTVQYNLCNEPWMKYSMSVVADRGLSCSQLTSARLRREVLLLETHSQRYELSSDSYGRGGTDAPTASDEDTYRWVRCLRPHTLSALQTVGLPVPDEECEPMYSKIGWEEFRWSNAGVQVSGKFFPIVRLQFMDRRTSLKSLQEAPV
mmetsp:Transcript_31535/g.52989  ORF Transcript_31535/g.52989 Transcript_31535/m.52989 type:complete len:424 (-) Transcript_31535:302-1573(-)|eukprot:CAMPEP_0198198696 /NCGR_PEP_ID=MMETSP1445-20131203/2123_1 /TAXON_ID=36898 /ORGANISM="Pyramimonas sp., Strain CCMP2087" /LENGTH=423 /DNA_ID=CAMNT_0043868325 /DNA_START=182 /DNA_END=1453 /DNA_ORIENTATION=-